MVELAKRVVTVAGTILLWAISASSSSAQPIDADVPPVVQATDENGVDQVSGRFSALVTSISIGPGGPGSLRYNWSTAASGSTELFGYIDPDAPTTGKYSVVIGGSTETFTLTGSLGSGTFTQDQGRSSTLTYDAANLRYTYTRILERPKPYRWQDVNEYDFRRCLRECIAAESDDIA